MIKQGDHVRSRDERDNPDEVYVVVEADVRHVSGSVVKIEPLDRPVWMGTYRLVSSLVPA